MHDPMTVAFDIYGPVGMYRNWKRKRLQSRRNSEVKDVPYTSPVAVVWHVDPELDGSDDSCGYSYARLSKEERDRVDRLADTEYDVMFGEYSVPGGASTFEILWGIWGVLAWRMDRRRNGKFTTAELNRILSAAAWPTDNLQRTVSEVIAELYENKRKESNRRLWYLVYRIYKTHKRPWYRRPRWHVHHWRIAFPVLTSIKRYFFSKCTECGKGFRWGYAPVSMSWGSDGPQWFKSEKNVYHHECADEVHRRIKEDHSHQMQGC